MTSEENNFSESKIEQNKVNSAVFEISKTIKGKRLCAFNQSRVSTSKWHLMVDNYVL